MIPMPAKKTEKRLTLAEHGPNPGEISAKEMADRLEITAQSLGMWCKRPGAPVRTTGARVWVRAADFLRWRENELCRQAVDEATKSLRSRLDADDGESSRARLERSQARKAEIEVELLERSVVRVEEAASITEKLLTDLRAVLVPFPRTASPKLIGAKTVVEMEQRLHAEVVRLMNALAAEDGDDMQAAA